MRMGQSTKSLAKNTEDLNGNPYGGRRNQQQQSVLCPPRVCTKTKGLYAK